MSNLKVIVTGVTGMVGEGVLETCIQSQQVEKILIITRKPSGISHPKVQEIVHADLSNISPLRDQLQGYDACFFCLGVSSIGMKEADYTAVTYTLTLNFATVLAECNPQMTFCYVSGASTDSSEKGKQMWARVKGKTENDLMKLPFKVYNFRPAFMRPFKNARNIKTIFKVIDVIFPLLRLFSASYFLTLEEVGTAMINVSRNGYSKQILEVEDISKLSKQA